MTCNSNFPVFHAFVTSRAQVPDEGMALGVDPGESTTLCEATATGEWPLSDEGDICHVVSSSYILHSK